MEPSKRDIWRWIVPAVGVLVVLVAVAYVALRVSTRPYAAEASGSDRFVLEVPYWRVVPTFSAPGSEDRFVELSGGGRVVQSSWKKVEVAPGTPEDGRGEGIFGRMVEAVANGQVHLRGEVTVEPGDDRLGAERMTFNKEVRAEIGQLRIESRLAEPAGMLRRHQKTMVMRRVPEGVEVVVDVTIGIEYPIPPLEYARRQVRQGVEDAVADELAGTRRAVAGMLQAEPE